MPSAGVFIGRFQPLHNGHIEIINQMIQEVDHPIIIIGSASGPRTPLNPFTFQERVKMLQDIFGNKITIFAAEDYKYQDNEWLARINTIIDCIKVRHEVDASYVTIYGYKKDDSSQYLGWFPAYKYKEVITTNPVLNSTDIRELMFCPYFDPSKTYVENSCEKVGLHRSTYADICKYYNEAWFFQLRNEFEYIKTYKKQSQFVAPF